MDQMTIYLILAGVFGLFMAWGIGANDVANAMATSVGSGALRIKQAVILAAIFEFAGAYLAGGEVTKTIRKGIVEPDAMGHAGGIAGGRNLAVNCLKKRLAGIYNPLYRRCCCRFCSCRNRYGSGELGQGWNHRDELGGIAITGWYPGIYHF